MEKKPPLSVVSNLSATATHPPPSLAEVGRSLWNRVMTEYRIQDCGGLEMLFQACAAADRAAALAALIDRDGEVIRTKAGPRAHPALKDELACRAFVVRTLRNLGLDVEPIRTIGRPGSAIGWVPP
jgi:hypothetical protein